MGEKLILSICMMVKNEEENLERCLNSLSTLLNREDVELIIVDTGSTDNTINIAKKYTEKVYIYEWNHNFSYMRNVSISYAKGEWIFIIDADEELEDAEEVSKLFEDEKLSSYNTIQINGKNLISLKDQRYTYFETERFFRNDGRFRYDGSVHNQPRYKLPILKTEILLLHYGYINDDKELMERKFQRTSALLKNELAKNPEHLYYRFQLARTYFMHQDYKQALQEIRIAYSDLQKCSQSDIKMNYYIYGEYARISLLAGHYQETQKICYEGLKIKPDYIDLYFYLGDALFDLQDKEQGIKVFEKYLELHQKFSGFTKNKAIELYTIDEKSKSVVAYKVTSYFYELKHYQNVLKYADLVEEHVGKINLVVKASIQLNEYEYLYKYYKQIEDENLKLFFINSLENEKSNLAEEPKEKLYRAFSTGSDSYARLNAVRISDNKKMTVMNFISENDLNQLSFYPYYKLFSYAIESQISLVSTFKKLTTSNLKGFIKELIDKDERARDYFIEHLQEGKVRANDFHSNRVSMAIAQVVLLSAIEEKKINMSEIDELYIRIFDNYIKNGKNYIDYLYKIEHLRLIYQTLDDKDEKFLIIMKFAVESLGKGNFELALKYYRDAIDIYPYFSVLVNTKIKEVKSQLQKEVILSTFNNIDSKELKVLHGTIEIANQMNCLVSGLNDLGITAKGLNYHPSYLKYISKHVYNLENSSIKDNEYTKEIAEKATEKFNVFHFHFGTTLMPDYMDLPLLKEQKKPIFMNHWGTDVRLYSIAKKLNSYAVVKDKNEEHIKRKLSFLAQYIDNCIVGDYELYEYVKPFYKKVHILRQAIDLNDYSTSDFFSDLLEVNSKPLIVHAPTSPEFKGTKYILKTIEELRQHYQFDFILVQNKSHEEAKKIYEKADLIIDQILAGGYGLFAVEAMAMGKPVITWISEFMRDKYPRELPIISANPENLKEKIEMALKDYQMRIELGRKGIEYVKRYHDVNVIARELLCLYKSN